MELLAPSALWWLLALGVLLLLPRVRVPHDRRPAATLHLWRDAQAADAKQPLVRLKRNLLLLLQAAALLAIIGALARPVVSTRAKDVAVVIDLSASMAARNGNGTRLDLARSEATRIVEALPYGSRVRFIGAGETVSALSALEDVHPGSGEADLESAVRVARGAGASQIFVISDDPDGLSDGSVQFVGVGAAAANVALTLFSARRLPNSAFDVEVVLELRNFAPSPASRTLSIAGATGELHRERLDLPAGGTVRRTFAVQQLQGALTARIDPADALAVDDERTITLPAAVRVAVSGEPSAFVRAALHANPDVRLDGDDAAEIIVCACDEVPGGDAHVLLVAPSRVVAPADAQRLSRDSRVAAWHWTRQQRRIALLALDATDAVVTRDAGFPLAVADAIQWLRGESDDVATRASERESDLRAAAPSRPPSGQPQATAAARRVPLDTILFALAALVVAAEWLIAARRRTSPDVRWRAAIVCCLLASAAHVGIPAGEGSAAVMFAVDRSASLSPRAQAEAEQRVAGMASRMRANDRVGVISFGDDALVQAPLSSSLASFRADGETLVGTRATDIAAGIRVAHATLGDTGARRIVVVSDGAATQGDAVREAAAAADQGIAVDVVAVAEGRRGDARVARVQAPPVVRTGQPFTVDVTVEGPAGSTVPFVLFRDGSDFARGRAVIRADGVGVAQVTDRVSRDAATTYTAAAGVDPLPEWTTAGTAVISVAAPSVLYVSARRPDATFAGFPVEHATIQRVPASADQLSRHFAIVLDDVNAADISAAQVRAFADYVSRIGGGLLVRGGARVLGPAGYPQSGLDSLLPVDFRARSGSRSADMAFVVAFDKSGSMADTSGGATKIDVARRAVLAVRDIVPAGDALGVIAFDATPSVIAPLAPPPAAVSLGERLGTLVPHGGTRIAPAMSLARGWLDASGAARQHILLITDGQSDDGDAEAVAAALRNTRATLTIIAVGNDSDVDFFRKLADRTRAAVHAPSELGSLPALAAREAAQAAGGSLVSERFVPRVTSAHPIVRGIRDLVPLESYVAGVARPDAVTVLGSHLGDPVLAVRQHGLGRVAVLATDGPAHDARGAFARVWTETIRWSGAARFNSSEFDPQVIVRDNRAVLTVDAVNGTDRFVNGLTGDVVVRAPSGEVRTVRMVQTSPGRYTAMASFDEQGTYVFHAVLRDPAGAEHVVRRAFYWSAPAERPRATADVAALGRIAAAGGGRLLTAADDPFDQPRPSATRDVSGLLGAVALILFLLDVARRRGVSWAAARRVFRPAVAA